MCCLVLLQDELNTSRKLISTYVANQYTQICWLHADAVVQMGGSDYSLVITHHIHAAMLDCTISDSEYACALAAGC
jgi:hypothetical protein